MEEMEHKGVAFDVLRDYAKGSYSNRVRSMLLVTPACSRTTPSASWPTCFQVDGFSRLRPRQALAEGLWWLYKWRLRATHGQILCLSQTRCFHHGKTRCPQLRAMASHACKTAATLSRPAISYTSTPPIADPRFSPRHRVTPAQVKRPAICWPSNWHFKPSALADGFLTCCALAQNLKRGCGLALQHFQERATTRRDVAHILSIPYFAIAARVSPPPAMLKALDSAIARAQSPRCPLQTNRTRTPNGAVPHHRAGSHQLSSQLGGCLRTDVQDHVVISHITHP